MPDGSQIRSAAQTNAGNLSRFVETALRDAPHKMEPVRHLRLSALKVEAYIRAVSEAAAADREPPAFLIGLSAFELSDAMDRLNAAARIIEREGLGAFTAKQREAA
jgi:hypothetical protein